MNITNKSIKWAVIIGMVILVNVFVNYAIKLAYPAPEYSQYCPEFIYPKAEMEANHCVQNRGVWVSNETYPNGGWCDTNLCYSEYNEANEKYLEITFIILVVIAVMLFVLTFRFKRNEVLSMSFAWSAVLMLIVSSFRVWSIASDIAKLIILGIGLGILIYISYKKFTLIEDKNNEEKEEAEFEN